MEEGGGKIRAKLRGKKNKGKAGKERLEEKEGRESNQESK